MHWCRQKDCTARVEELNQGIHWRKGDSLTLHSANSTAIKTRSQGTEKQWHKGEYKENEGEKMIQENQETTRR